MSELNFKYVRIQGKALARNTMHAKGIFSLCWQLIQEKRMDVFGLQVALQQAMGERKSLVMDGRDIGTKVFPDAERSPRKATDGMSATGIRAYRTCPSE